MFAHWSDCVDRNDKGFTFFNMFLFINIKSLCIKKWLTLTYEINSEYV